MSRMTLEATTFGAMLFKVDEYEKGTRRESKKVQEQLLGLYPINRAIVYKVERQSGIRGYSESKVEISRTGIGRLLRQIDDREEVIIGQIMNSRFKELEGRNLSKILDKKNKSVIEAEYISELMNRVVPLYMVSVIDKEDESRLLEKMKIRK